MLGECFSAGDFNYVWFKIAGRITLGLKTRHNNVGFCWTIRYIGDMISDMTKDLYFS